MFPWALPMSSHKTIKSRLKTDLIVGWLKETDCALDNEEYIPKTSCDPLPGPTTFKERHGCHESHSAVAWAASTQRIKPVLGSLGQVPTAFLDQLFQWRWITFHSLHEGIDLLPVCFMQHPVGRRFRVRHLWHRPGIEGVPRHGVYGVHTGFQGS